MSNHGSENNVSARGASRESGSGGGRPSSVDLAELTLAVYVEELVARKKVLFVGDPTSAAPERLARAARSVEVVSTRSRVRGTRRGGRVASRRWPTEEDAGLWDVVLIPDLPAAGLADDDRIAEVARWLAPGGVLVAGTPDPEGPAAHASALTYEALFDLLDSAFEHVRMLGQAPFSGFSVVDFAPAGELGVTFDGSILEGAGERAQRYYAVCGERDVVLDAYAVVQVPTAALGPAPVREPVRASDERGRLSELAERVREQQDALDAAGLHAEEVERELHAARAELARANERVEGALGERETLTVSLEAARAELARADGRVEGALGERETLTAALEATRAELSGAMARASAAQRELESGAGDDREYVALEASLHERGGELTALRAEVERRGTLVRDLIEELREARVTGGAAEPAGGCGALREKSAAPIEDAAVERALGRAVSAEAEKAALAFRLDEVRGELAVLQQRERQDVDALRQHEAGLQGTVRGLRARIAELEERHQLLQGRLALAEDDRGAAEARNRRLVRELAEAREQVELEIARATVEDAQRGVDAPEVARLRAVAQTAAEREGQLAGALMRSREALAELGTAKVARDDARADGLRAGYEARIRELVRELDQQEGEAARALAGVGELRDRAASAEQDQAQLRGELAGVRLRLSDREEAVRALHTAELERGSRVVVAGRREQASGELEAELARVTAESDALRAELANARRAATVEYARDGGMEERVAALNAMVGARDALIARIQRGLADGAERHLALEGRLEECAAALTRSREELESARAVADVRGTESGRELQALTARLERTERERREALDGLEEARAILTQLAGDLPTRREAPDDGASPWHLRERIARLDADAADREVLLRSLTAQLQERDDRIRALERMHGGGPPDDESVLRARLFEMEERVARLQDELDHERAR